MKICYVADSIIPSRSANSIHVMRMCDAYAALGHQVTLVVPRWRFEDAGVEDVTAYYGVAHPFDIRHVYAPRWERYEIAFYGLLLPAVTAWMKPDLVHTRKLAVAWGLTRLLRKEVLLEAHEPWGGSKRQQALLSQVADSGRLRALIVITRALAGYMAQKVGNMPIIIAPDGVASSLMARALTQDNARVQVGLQDERRRIAVYAGHLYSGRGIELIIDVARHVSDHLFLVVGGNDKDVAMYRRLASDLDNVRFAGFVLPAQVQTYLAAADVLLMPYAPRVYTAGGSESGQFASPMKMFEYMAAERPLLASTLPVLQEVLSDGVNALLLPYDKPQCWVEALRTLQANPSLAQSLGRRARADVEPYTWERRAQRILGQVGIGRVAQMLALDE